MVQEGLTPSTHVPPPPGANVWDRHLTHLIVGVVSLGILLHSIAILVLVLHHRGPTHLIVGVIFLGGLLLHCAAVVLLVLHHHHGRREGRIRRQMLQGGGGGGGGGMMGRNDAIRALDESADCRFLATLRRQERWYRRANAASAAANGGSGGCGDVPETARDLESGNAAGCGHASGVLFDALPPWAPTYRAGSRAGYGVKKRRR
ncbi:hypothetical protein GGR56DRAFT_692190 [Xylariaceae sp. FL0804]|nr:hypothetical protein GGR56DRAFT_692190 [Xylariaceae sp. FL0804]